MPACSSAAILSFANPSAEAQAVETAKQTPAEEAEGGEVEGQVSHCHGVSLRLC